MTVSSLRVDARRNRERLLAAAERLFLQDGISVTLEGVARAAGVGIGTLYRRFRTREALLAALCDHRLLMAAARSEATSAGRKPSVALRSLVEELASITRSFNGLAGSIGVVLGHPTDGCAATTIEASRLLSLARQEREIRPEVTMDDLISIISAAAFSATGSDQSEAQIKHFVGLFFDGAAVAPN